MCVSTCDVCVHLTRLLLPHKDTWDSQLVYAIITTNIFCKCLPFIGVSLIHVQPKINFNCTVISFPVFLFRIRAYSHTNDIHNSRSPWLVMLWNPLCMSYMSKDVFFNTSTLYIYNIGTRLGLGLLELGPWSFGMDGFLLLLGSSHRLVFPSLEAGPITWLNNNRIVKLPSSCLTSELCLGRWKPKDGAPAQQDRRVIWLAQTEELL